MEMAIVWRMIGLENQAKVMETRKKALQYCSKEKVVIDVPSKMLGGNVKMEITFDFSLEEETPRSYGFMSGDLEE